MEQRFTKEYPFVRIFLFLLLAGILVSPLLAVAEPVRGESLLWTRRVSLLGESLPGGFSLFLPGDVVANEKLGAGTFASNLSVLFPGLLALLGMDAFFALKVWMGALQLLGLLTAGICAERLLGKTFEGMALWLVFVTCPYRLLVFFLKWSPSEALIWTVVPILICSLSLMGEHEKKNRILALGMGSLALALVAYADMTVFPLVAGAFLVAALWIRRPVFLLGLAAGTVFSAPALVYYLRYILKGGMEVYGIPGEFIQASGYRFGQFFTAYAVQYFYPGFGIPLMLGILACLGLALTGKLPEKTRERKQLALWMILTVCLCIPASAAFPWNRIMSLNGGLGRFLSVLGTPVLFAGAGQMAACGVFALTLRQVRRLDGRMVRNLIPLLGLAAGVLEAVWICNDLVL